MANKSNTKSKATTSTASKLARRKNRGQSDNPLQAEYEQLNHQNIARLIDAVANSGGTVTFGYTRDGGAYFINYWCDGESLKVYIRPTEEPDDRLVEEIEFWLGE